MAQISIMKTKTQDALDSFCRHCPDIKMIKAYEHQGNDDLHLMELAYYSYLEGKSIEVQSFKTSGAENNNMGLTEANLQEWAETAKRECDRYRECVHLLGNLGHLK